MHMPPGRIADPEEVAALAIFLLSDACAAMTGQIIAVDGGQSVPLAALGFRWPERARADGAPVNNGTTPTLDLPNPSAHHDHINVCIFVANAII
jgi:hypothetical protein